jgi:hypothetical protein
MPAWISGPVMDGSRLCVKEDTGPHVVMLAVALVCAAQSGTDYVPTQGGER